MSKKEKIASRQSFSPSGKKTKAEIEKEHPELRQTKNKHLPDFTEALYEMTQLSDAHHDHKHHEHESHHHHTEDAGSHHHRPSGSKRQSSQVRHSGATRHNKDEPSTSHSRHHDHSRPSQASHLHHESSTSISIHSHHHDHSRPSQASSLHHQGSTSVSPFAGPSSTVYPFDGIDRLPPSLPPGLREMPQSTYLFLHRHIGEGDTFIVCGKLMNHFDILNATGDKLYRTFEGSETFCNGMCCPAFSFTTSKLDAEGDFVNEDLIYMAKRFHFFTAKRYIKVYSPPDTCVGVVRQNWKSVQEATFVLVDPNGQELLEITVDKFPYSKEHPAIFMIKTIKSKEIIGKMNGKYIPPPTPKAMGEYRYDVTFPKQLNSNVKLLVMGAWLVIYKLYFDKPLRKELKEYIKRAIKEKEE